MSSPYWLRPRHPLRGRGLQAFSFMELLAVMAVLGVLAALLIPSLHSVSRGTQLAQSANLVAGEMSLARQHATSRNRTVEVRFYRYQNPGESGASTSPRFFRAIQLFEIDERGAAFALGKIKEFPLSIILDSNPALSSILSPGQEKAWTDEDPQVSLPRIGTQYECRSFRFHADGATSLNPPTAAWYLTLHGIGEGDELEAPPKNFCCLQIDTFNGQVRSFKP